MSFVTKVTLFQNVQEAQRKSAPSMPALSQDVSSLSARDSAMVSLQCWPELLWQGHDHKCPDTGTEILNLSLKLCSLGISLGICKAALYCVAMLSLLKGTFMAVWVDVQFRHMQSLGANLKA